MTALAYRHWVPKTCEMYIQSIARHADGLPSDRVASHIDKLIERNREIHERECFNLNPEK